MFNANIPELSTADYTTLNATELTSPVDYLNGYIAMVGFDLDDFFDDCRTASDSCDPTDYYDYDGYSIVIAFNDTSLANTQYKWGFCLAHDNTCIIADPTYGNFDFTQLVLPVSLRTSNPSEQVVDGDSASECETYTGGFSEDCWGWNPNMPVDGGWAQVWRYLEITDRYKLVAGDTTTVWGVTSQTGTDNVMQSVTLAHAVKNYGLSLFMATSALAIVYGV